MNWERSQNLFMKTEKELLQLLKDGNEEAVKFIFEQYYENLCLYAESITKNHQIAEEIVEDIFIHIWINAKDTSIVLSVKNYLFRSTHNNCIKYLNKLKTEKKVFDNQDYTLTDNEILHPLNIEYPIANLIFEELEKKAGEILQALPGQCKEIYALNRFENLSYTEIATKLNITVGTVKTQMSRAFQKFREGLKEFLPVMLLWLFLK
jgi:RNA polymerase sigma-70 factor (family 1)